MRSDLFSAHVEVEDGDRVSLQNSRLVKVVLDGEVLARQGDSLTVNGVNVLAFEPELTWDIRKVEGATVLFHWAGPAG
jgi:hypothetical protein